MEVTLSQGGTDATLTDSFLNKFMLPKMALTVISIASILGVTFTSLAQGIDAPWAIALRWIYLAAAGGLLGISTWGGFIVSWASRLQPPGGEAFISAEDELYRRWRFGLGIAAVVGVVGYGAVSHLAPGSMPYLALSGVLALVAGLWPMRGRAAERTVAILAALALAVLAFLEAGAEGAPNEGTLLLRAGVRVLHLLAFGLWFGGAIWNIFINAASGRRTLSFATVVASHLQLEGFRWVVRFAFPTIVLTGLAQAYLDFGLNFSVYWQTLPGMIVLAKLVLAAMLVVIFFTCPMWGACSPIAGVCRLEDLTEMAPEGSEAS